MGSKQFLTPLFLKVFTEKANLHMQAVKQYVSEQKIHIPLSHGEEYAKLIYSGRKTIGIQIDEKLNIVVRAPYTMKKSHIERFVCEKREWIEKNLDVMRKRVEEHSIQKIELLSASEVRRLADEALMYIPGRVEYFAENMGVSYGRITIRCQRTRWGSCSSIGNLNFNCLLMLVPPKVIDYVVVHELCHRLEMNHSPLFWKRVGEYMPDYEIYRKWLKDNGYTIMKKIG